jgi:hypothetical protein
MHGSMGGGWKRKWCAYGDGLSPCVGNPRNRQPGLRVQCHRASRLPYKKLRCSAVRSSLERGKKLGHSGWSATCEVEEGAKLRFSPFCPLASATATSDP